MVELLSCQGRRWCLRTLSTLLNAEDIISHSYSLSLSHSLTHTYTVTRAQLTGSHADAHACAHSHTHRRYTDAYLRGMPTHPPQMHPARFEVAPGRKATHGLTLAN